MAENTTADNILSQILEETNRHNDLLVASMTQAQMIHKKSTKTDAQEEQIEKRRAEFAKRQQGQEVQFSKKNQFYNNQISQQTDELEMQNWMQIALQSGDSGDGVGQSAERTANASEALKDQGKKTRKDAVDSFNEEKKHRSKWATRWTKEVKEAKSVDNLLGAMKTDASLLLGSTAALTQIPGIQTALTGIKFLVANFVTMMKWLTKKFFPNLIPAMKRFFYNPSAVRKKAKDEWLATKNLEAKRKQKVELVDTGVLGADGKPMMKEVMGPLEKVNEDDYKPEKEGMGFITRAFATAGFVMMLKRMGTTISKIIKTVLWPAIMSVVGMITGAFTALAASLGIGLLPLALIVIAVIGLGVLMYIFWDKIKIFWQDLTNWWTELTEVKIPNMINNLTALFWEKWDAMTAAIGEALTKAKEKLMGWGETISEFFSDFKTQAWLNLQEMFVSILEGIQSAVNWVIRKVNNIPGVTIAEVDFAGSMRTDLDADKAVFAAKKAARGQELEDGSLGVRSAAGAGGQQLPAGFGGKTAVANVTNLQQSRTYVATGTGSSDAYARAAGANA